MKWPELSEAYSRLVLQFADHVRKINSLTGLQSGGVHTRFSRKFFEEVVCLSCTCNKNTKAPPPPYSTDNINPSLKSEHILTTTVALQIKIYFGQPQTLCMKYLLYCKLFDSREKEKEILCCFILGLTLIYGVHTKGERVQYSVVIKKRRIALWTRLSKRCMQIQVGKLMHSLTTMKLHSNLLLAACIKGSCMQEQKTDC